MSATLIDPELGKLKRRFAETLLKLQDLAKQRKLEKELVILQDSLAMMNNPYQFVVVGEVKSGKSSFINALLGVQVCRVDPRPCTDMVQEIVFGDDESEELRGKNLKRISRPVEILKSVAIVDTPGTNTVIERHQVITESYIPLSDLVVFVFPAKNPHTKTAWDLLSLVSAQWRRKVVFVLQQKDLETEHLETQMESVRELAIKHDVPDMVVFATSARWELEGKTATSGFAEIRRFIRGKVTGGKHLYEKLEGQIATASNICESLERSLLALRRQLEADQELERKIKSQLDCGAGRSTKKVDTLIDRLVAKYEDLEIRCKKEFSASFGMTAILRWCLPFGESPKLWLEDLQKRFEGETKTTLDEITKHEMRIFVDDIKHLTFDMLQAWEKLTTAKLGLTAADSLEKCRSDITESVKAKLHELSQNVDSPLSGWAESTGGMDQAIGVTGAVAALIVVIGTVTKVAMTSLSEAGVTLFWKRGPIIKQFEKGLDQSKDRLRQDLKESLETNLRSVYAELERIFHPFLDHLRFCEQELIPQIVKLEESRIELQSLCLETKKAVTTPH